MLQIIIDCIKELSHGTNTYLLATPIVIKTTPHTPPFNIYGVSVSPADVVYVMDNNQEWWAVSENDVLVVNSVYQRVRVARQTVNN